MTRDRIIAVVLLLMMIAAAALGSRPAKQVDESRSTRRFDAGGAAAWYQVAQREGIDVQQFTLPHHDLADAVPFRTLVQTLPGFGARQTWEAGANADVHAWIARGNHLVVAGAFVPDTHDANEFDLAFKTVFGKPGALRGPWSAQISDLPDRGALRLTVPKHASVLLADRLGALVVRRTIGRGSMTEAVSADAIINADLAHGDNARLSYLLIAAPDAPGPVAFDETLHGYGAALRPWYTALNAGEILACSIVAFALLLWLAGGFFPLGPPVRIIPPREPTSAEFLDAVAGLYARARTRAHAAALLVADARRLLARAAQTPETRDLRARIDASDAAAQRAPLTDAALLDLARLAYLARKDSTTRERRRQHAP